jgi:hypothetical protein
MLELAVHDSTQRQQQLQLQLQQLEEQAATQQLQMGEHVQRLQVLHAEALCMREQELAMVKEANDSLSVAAGRWA